MTRFRWLVAASMVVVSTSARAADECGDSAVEALAFSPDGGTVCATGTHLRCWSTATGAQLFAASIDRCQGIHDLAFLPDGSAVVTVDSHALRTWDARTGAPKSNVPYTDFEPQNVAVSPSGTVVAVSVTNGSGPQATTKIDLRMAATGALWVSVPTTCTGGMAVAPDGKIAAFGDSVCGWGADGKPLPNVTGADQEGGAFDGVRAVVWSKSGATLYVVTIHTVASYDVASGRYVADKAHLPVVDDEAIVDSFAGSANAFLTADGSVLVHAGGEFRWIDPAKPRTRSVWRNVDGVKFAYSPTTRTIALGAEGDADLVLIAEGDAKAQRKLRAWHGTSAPAVAATTPGASGDAPPAASPAGDGAALTDVPPNLKRLAIGVGTAVDNIVNHVFPEELSFGNTFDDEKAASDRCDKAVAAAFGGGLPATAKISANYNERVPGLVADPRNSNHQLLSLGAVKTVVCGKAREIYLTARMAASAYDAAQSLFFARKEQKIGLEFSGFVENWNTCSKVAVQVHAEGIGDDVMVPYNNFHIAELPTPVRFGDLDKKVCRAAQALGGDVAKALKVAEDKKYAPYVGVLSGDKKKMFRERSMLDGTNWYGPGGRSLSLPDHFKQAGAWYYFVHDRNVWPDRWKVEGWVFSGDKMVRTYTKGGVGEEPPGSAYP